MTGPHRLPGGGLIDRTRPLAFTFDGQAFSGFAGDTLASALMANGVRLVGRSFKYHRPRGILTAGSEEPNALVELGAGARREPNTRATSVTPLASNAEASVSPGWPSYARPLNVKRNVRARSMRPPCASRKGWLMGLRSLPACTSS